MKEKTLRYGCVIVVMLLVSISVQAQTYVFGEGRDENIIEISGNVAVWTCPHCPNSCYYGTDCVIDRMTIVNDEFRSRRDLGLSCMVARDKICVISRDRNKVICSSSVAKCVYERER